MRDSVVGAATFPRRILTLNHNVADIALLQIRNRAKARSRRNPRHRGRPDGIIGGQRNNRELNDTQYETIILRPLYLLFAMLFVTLPFLSTFSSTIAKSQ